MTTQSADALGEGAVSWCGPLDIALYDRRELVRQEQVALAELSMDLLRRHGHRGDSQLWQPVQRLLRPLEDAHAALCWQPSDLRQHRRFAVDAMGLVLVRTGQLRRTYWQWSTAEWTSLVGTSTREFLDPWPGWLDKGVRPYVLAYAYLLGAFTGMRQIGRFHRNALAWRVFGRDLVEAAVGQVSEALAGWGYHGTEAHHATALCQLLLINRSPFLQDLTSEFLLRARRERLAGVRLDSTVHAIHRALAELGHVTLPPAPVFNQWPVAIDGAPAVRWSSAGTPPRP